MGGCVSNDQSSSASAAEVSYLPPITTTGESSLELTLLAAVYFTKPSLADT